MGHITDLYATFAELAGVDPADAKCAANPPVGASTCPPVDALSMWPLWSGANATSPRTELPLNSLLPAALSSNAAGFIGEAGRFKLIRGTAGDIFPGPHMPNSSASTVGGHADCTAGCLFDLEADMTEHVDLAKDPKVLRVAVEVQERSG
jgi:arylsulfatase I/J